MDNKLIHYPIFKSCTELFAFTTTRQTLDLPNVRYSSKAENKKALADRLNVPPENMIFPQQTHTSCVIELDRNNDTDLSDTDALVTNQAGLCICVQTADCVPVLLFDPVKKVVSAVHAGWRGTVGRIVENAVRKMEKGYGSQPKNILAAIGPSISPEVYEVGSEVVEAVQKEIPNARLSLHKNQSGKWHLDLWEANRQLLLNYGVEPGHIEISNECTFLNKDKYFSARRDGIETGRMVSGIMIRSRKAADRSRKLASGLLTD